MDEFTVSGRFRARHDSWQRFETRMEAPNESVATEWTYAEFGSRHGLKRVGIEISDVSPLAEAGR